MISSIKTINLNTKVANFFSHKANLIAIFCYFVFNTYLSVQADLEVQKSERAKVLQKQSFNIAYRKNISSNQQILSKFNEHKIKPPKKKQLWSFLQHKMQNSVVQVFSQVAEFNWLEPYKTPAQGEVTGTAFFVSKDGKLITNAHVVLEAKMIFIQIPYIGKRRFVVDIIGISPERDLALLKLNPEELKVIKKELKTEVIPYIKFGDSDTISRGDKIMALGFPLGQENWKITTGVVSGRQNINGQYFIQTSAPLNKGNSGGPSVDRYGEVVGVNTAAIPNAQNVGYFIPINEVRLFLQQLQTLPANTGPKLLRKPFLGFLFNNANENLTKFLKNPEPGGLYIVEIYKGSPLHKSGIKAGDMIYKINGHSVDVYGDMNVPWSKEDKVSIIDYVSRLKIGQKMTIEYYRKGKKHITSFVFTQTERPPIRRMYPDYEKIDYQIIGGMVIMPLTLSHIMLLAQYAPELVQYADLKKHMEPALVVSHVQLNSPAHSTRCIGPGSIISEVNGQKVQTIEEFKKVVKQSITTGFLTIKTSESIFFVLPIQEILANERKLSSLYFYPLSEVYLDIEKKYALQNKLKINNDTLKGSNDEKLFKKLLY